MNLLLDHIDKWVKPDLNDRNHIESEYNLIRQAHHLTGLYNEIC